MHNPTNRITHTTAFGIPVMEHWLVREIAQWVHHKGSIWRLIAPWMSYWAVNCICLLTKSTDLGHVKSWLPLGKEVGWWGSGDRLTVSGLGGEVGQHPQRLLDIVQHVQSVTNGWLNQFTSRSTCAVCNKRLTKSVYKPFNKCSL